VIAVASITGTGAISSFCNYGSTTIDSGAPGFLIFLQHQAQQRGAVYLRPTASNTQPMRYPSRAL
jgi:hypothetical protein